MNKYYVAIIISFILVGFVSANSGVQIGELDSSPEDEFGVRIYIPPTISGVINVSNSTVNNSEYWDGLALPNAPWLFRNGSNADSDVDISSSYIYESGGWRVNDPVTVDAHKGRHDLVLGRGSHGLSNASLEYQPV